MLALVESRFTASLDVGHLRDAEVEHLDAGAPVGAVCEKEVRGLEIAMDHPERVRLGERLGGLEQVVDRQLGREAALLLEELLEVLSLEVLHDQVRRAAGQRRHVAHAHHVLAANLDCGAAFAEESRDERRVVRQLGQAGT